MTRHLRLLTIPFLLVAAACSGRSSPTAPSGAGNATISGSVVDPGSSGGIRGVKPSASAHGLTVFVLGSDLSAPVNGGRFDLSGIPAGPLTLRFAGNGMDSSLPLAPVGGSEEIDLAVSMDGGSVALESERRSLGSQVQLEGRVESLPPTAPADQFIVAGQLVTTTADTKFFVRGAPATFADLAIGVRVHVKGQAAGDALTASIVDIQNTNGELPVNINGIIENLLVSGTDFELTIEGRLIKGDVDTEFFGGTVFADLANGERAEVKGLQQDGYVYARRLHISDDDEDEEPSDTSDSIEGILNSIGGSGDALTLLVGTTTVLTDGGTEVQRRGDRQELSVLQLGMRLHVVGTRQPDGSILARKLQIKGDATGSAVRLAGSMGGVKGTCPSIEFSINGYRVKASGATTFSPAACSTFKSGTKVVVEGTAQADGSVLAVTVTKS
jgi:hypothetical protein